MQPKPRPGKAKKALISDLVWGVCTLLSFLYALYLTYRVLFTPLEGYVFPIVAMLFFWFVTLLLATQAPDKGQ